MLKPWFSSPLDCTFCILLKCSRVVYTVYSSWLLTGSVQANEFHHIRWFLVTDGRASQIGIDLFFLDQDFGIEFLNMSASLSVSVADWLQHWIFFAPVAVYYCLLQWKFSSIPTHCAPNHQSTIPCKTHARVILHLMVDDVSKLFTHQNGGFRNSNTHVKSGETYKQIINI